MPFNWPKCGPALSLSRQSRPSTLEVSHLRRARIMLSQSLAWLEREKPLQDSGAVLPKLEGKPNDFPLVAREGEVEVPRPEPQDVIAPLIDASYGIAQEHDCTPRTCETPSTCPAFSVENGPGKNAGKGEVVEAPIPCDAVNEECPSVSDHSRSADVQITGMTLPSENSFVLVNPERQDEAAASVSSIPLTNCYSGLSEGEVRVSPKVLFERKSSTLRSGASVGRCVSRHLDRIKETGEGLDSQKKVNGQGSSSPADFGQIVLVETRCAMERQDIARSASDQMKLQQVGETGVREKSEGDANGEKLAGDAVGATSGDTKGSVEGKARRRDLRFQEVAHGRFLEGRLVYRQTFVVRSYEVGLEKTASVDTLTNLFQVLQDRR